MVAQSQQEAHSLTQGRYPDQRSIQHFTHKEDRDHDSDDKESLEYPDFPPPSPNKQHTLPSYSNSMSSSNSNSNPSTMHDDKTMQVTFLSYEVAATDTTQLADTAITLLTSHEEMLTDLVHKYL